MSSKNEIAFLGQSIWQRSRFFFFYYYFLIFLIYFFVIILSLYFHENERTRAINVFNEEHCLGSLTLWLLIEN